MMAHIAVGWIKSYGRIDARVFQFSEVFIEIMKANNLCSGKSMLCNTQFGINNKLERCCFYIFYLKSKENIVRK